MRRLHNICIYNYTFVLFFDYHSSPTRSTTCPRCARRSASRTRPASSAPPASTCSTFAASAPRAPWCWSTAGATSPRIPGTQLGRRQHHPDRSDRPRRRRSPAAVRRSTARTRSPASSTSSSSRISTASACAARAAISQQGDRGT